MIKCLVHKYTPHTHTHPWPTPDTSHVWNISPNKHKEIHICFDLRNSFWGFKEKESLLPHARTHTHTFLKLLGTPCFPIPLNEKATRKRKPRPQNILKVWEGTGENEKQSETSGFGKNTPQKLGVGLQKSPRGRNNTLVWAEPPTQTWQDRPTGFQIHWSKERSHTHTENPNI